MTQEDFANLYELYQKPALNVVISKFDGNRELADEALQASAVYFLERLDNLERITESYFIQKVTNMARDIRKRETRQYMRALPQGDGYALETIEEQELEKRLGRAYDPNSHEDAY